MLNQVSQKEEAAGGSIRDRLDRLTKDVNELDRVSRVLEGSLSPISRPATPELANGQGMNAPGIVQRAPQCNIAIGIDTASQVVQDCTARINEILRRLEI